MHSLKRWLAGCALVGASVWVLSAGCSAGGGSQEDDDGSSSTTTSQGAGGGLNLGGNSAGGGKQGGIPQTCQEAVDQQSYIGCEYWPTVTSNAGLYDGFEFAVVMTNPTNGSADVTVERGGNPVTQITLPAGGIETVTLPWVSELKGLDTVGDGSGITSVLATAAAYRVVSSVPITLYQFNPLEFEIVPPPFDCPDPAFDGTCHSYTNDASLMLPTTALRDDYYVVTRPTLHLGSGFGQYVNLPGFVAVTATRDGTTVNVETPAFVRAGPGVGALSPGQTASYTLNTGDVLMLQSGTPPNQDTPLPGQPCVVEPLNGITKCPTAPEYDLTGMHVTSNQPISVIGGHDCTFVPYSEFACDHLEESMFPVQALGQELVVSAPQEVSSIGVSSTPDNLYVRVLSAADGNQIDFEPAVQAPVTLDAGEWIEVGPVKQDFRVHGTNKILVAQFMVGENFTGFSVGAGDPALSVAIPIEQYRVSYAFLAPTTYTHNYVNIVKPANASVSIDGTVVPSSEFTSIGSTGLAVARHKIDGGYHSMQGDDNFGIVVYGYGSYTSYMYPGGLNLETVVVVPE